MKNEKEIAKSNLEMLKSYAKEFIHHGMELQKALKKENEIDAWVVAKAERATTDLSDITHYLDGKSEYEQGGEIDERESRFQKENELLDSVDKDYVIVMYNKKSGKNEILTSPDTFKTQRYRYTSLMNKQQLAGFEKIKIVQLQDLDFTYEYDGELFAKGGKLDKKATYVPKRDIAEVEVEKNGKTKFVDGADLLDGVYVNKSKYADGGEINYFSSEWVVVAKDNDTEKYAIVSPSPMFIAPAQKMGKAMLQGAKYKKLREKYSGFRVIHQDDFDENMVFKYEEGGQVDNGGMIYALAEFVSSGTIANKTNYENYDDISQIRTKAIQYYVENGDKPYSMGELEKVLMIVSSEQYAKGGQVSTYKKANWRFW